MQQKMKTVQLPTLNRFEADGGAWRNVATQRIADYIQSLVTVPVIA